MSERPLLDPLPEHIIDMQRQAAHPDTSTWVEANAGSGKTRVLTDRVLRLMLSGVRPDQILCLTYTKAAAAEMRQRLSDRLAEWTLADDLKLTRDLTALLGARPERLIAERARTLFVTALETPGGLKIQTIHAFCESVLHRFPTEAGVPFDFKVVDDYERETMVLEARERVIAAGINGDPALEQPVEVLFDVLSDFKIAEAIEQALSDNSKLKQVVADKAAAKQRLRRLVRYSKGPSSGELRDAIETQSLLLPGDARKVVELLGGDRLKTRGIRFADVLARANLDRPLADDLVAAFLTADGEPRGTLMPAKDAAANPDLFARLEAERDRIHGLSLDIVRASLVERSEALLDVLAAISARYEAEKRARSLLDFDDLVTRMGQLLRDESQGLWVRYKIDGGLTHILVDESQDTNPEQWSVFDALVQDFFEPGGIERPRTLFAVGDGKQSIYSFQGADPEQFLDKGDEYATRAMAGGYLFRKVYLDTSFRTLGGVLAAVDEVFRHPELQEGVLATRPVRHRTARRDEGGTVTLWPPVRELDDEADPDQWPLEIPRDMRSATRQVAERIAGEIAGWIKAQRPLAARGRAVRPDDVLILVQSRSSLFHEVIRALHRVGLPTPGADRLAVTGHIAVLDLLALGDVLLNTADDLQLAALLRSPLFGLSEDDLYELASPRPSGLWAALRHSTQPRAMAANLTLRAWRSRLDFDRPYGFFAQVLHAEGGLKRFHERFGREVDDVFAEFLELALAHEQMTQPSLQGFIAAMRSREVTIKRELNERGGGVRVMTVHGAKGLEAPIVILPDAASKPDARQTSRAVYLPILKPGPLLVHASSKSDHVPETLVLRDREAEKQQAEYWRKLYVGMTRAEDELYVTGSLTKQAKLDGTWYEAIDRGLRPLSEVVTDAEGAETAVHYPRERATALPVISAGAPAASLLPEPLELPPLPAPVILPVVRPSSAFVPADPLSVLETAAEAALDADTARRRGIAIHALLQHLGRVPADRRADVATRALETLLPDAPELHAETARRALSILGNPAFAEIFGPDSRAEVPFLAQARRKSEDVTLAGRFDRLVVTARDVLVVDFKSDATASMDAEKVPPGYLTQLGLYALVAHQLYPQLPVRAAILWTSLESLLELPRDALAEASRGFTMR